jgi:hypothetical protein
MHRSRAAIILMHMVVLRETGFSTWCAELFPRLVNFVSVFNLAYCISKSINKNFIKYFTLVVLDNCWCISIFCLLSERPNNNGLIVYSTLLL